MSSANKGTTDPGYENPNGQVVVRDTGQPGTDLVNGSTNCGASTAATLTARTEATFTNANARTAKTDGQPGLAF
jgi:hypothetical protein